MVNRKDWCQKVVNRSILLLAWKLPYIEAEVEEKTGVSGPVNLFETSELTERVEFKAQTRVNQNQKYQERGG
mgnify:CR=1 FL=1